MCCLCSFLESIDTIKDRQVTNLTLCFIRKNKNTVPNIVHRSELEKLFKKKDSFNWFTESNSFSVMVKCLSMPEYKHPVLVGLLVCIGGVSESIVRIF